MVIEKVINQSGVVDIPHYDYNYSIRKSILTYMEPFYYKKILVIDGITFMLGSLRKSKIDSLIEPITGSVALRDCEVHSFTDEDILCRLTEKVSVHLCDTLSDVVTYFQNNFGAYRTEVWQINFLIS